MSTDAVVVRRRFAEIDGLVARISSLQDAGRRGSWVTQALRDVLDVQGALGRVARGGVLEPADLLDIALVMGAAVVLAELVPPAVLPEHHPDAPGWVALRDALQELQPYADLADPDGHAQPPLAGLAARLRRAIDIDGEVPTLADAASPELAQARAQARQARHDLAAAAQRLVTGSELADALADRFWTERQGRVVLPVKAGSLSRGRGGDGVTGIIHGSSTSGQTFFVEPTALIEDNNRVRQAQARARAEERRVLAVLSAAVRQHVDAIQGANAAMARLDRIVARAELSAQLVGTAPRVWDPADPQSPGLSLPAARHPTMVLAGVPVVANDLAIRIGQGLVISGPNAGGKTVALKTMGLAILMTRAGVRLPTGAPADVPLFRQIVTDVGDGQSIAANLSTFTAHLRHVQRALDAAQRDATGTLVLLDEVAVGTDPDQGAALAEAILTRLVEVGATVVATTHYERLKLLATSPGPAGRFTNAAVGFDLAQLRPTFELHMGLPGSSSALAVARRLGLPEVVLARAQAMLDDTRLAVDVLLGELEAERVAMAHARQLLADERGAVARERLRLDARDRGEEDDEAKRRAKAHRAAALRLGELESEIALRRRQLRQAPLDSAPEGQAPPADAEARAFAGQARHGLAGHAPPRPAPEGQVPDTVAVGGRVWVASLQAEGDVVAVKGQRVTVQLATLKTTVARSDLRMRRRAVAKPVPRTHDPKAAAARARRHFGADALRFDPSLDDVVDLRGQRAEEAVTMMEVFLDRAVAEDREVVLLRHGHGTGALRKTLRDTLGRLCHVAEHRSGLPAEGGDAVTVVWVRG